MHLHESVPFTTADGSTIRELLNPRNSSLLNQSLAEATLPPRGATERHYHRRAEEIYFIVEGTGLMELDGDEREVRPGDAILIPPGAWHRIEATGEEGLRLLCCCAPGYRHDDTYFE